MEDKRYQVFISSTYQDLISAREKVIGTVLGLYHFPVGMEMFSAADAEQWEIIRETINVSDYYVLIVGHRYGSETSEGISYTEKEYDYAKDNDIPIYAFIRQRNVATTPEERDSDPVKIEKLNKFIEKATESKMCDFWCNEDELATKIAIALPKAFRRNPRVGWVRSDRAMSPEVSNEMANLSNENRGLRKELEILSAQLSNKKPEINLLINGDLKTTLIKKEIGHTKIKELESPPKKIKDADIPTHLNGYISVADIENFNASLPSEEVIEKYNSSLRAFLKVKKCSQPMLLSVSNIGSSKAHDVFVDIEFPAELVVIEKDKADSMTLPSSPMPKSLIDKAQNEYEKEIERRKNPLKFAMQSSLRDFDLTPIQRMNSLENVMKNIHKSGGNFTSLINNKITIKIDSLLHTRKINFDDFIVIPVKAGNYEITATIICEEYDQEQTATVLATVADEPNN